MASSSAVSTRPPISAIRPRSLSISSSNALSVCCSTMFSLWFPVRLAIADGVRPDMRPAPPLLEGAAVKRRQRLDDSRVLLTDVLLGGHHPALHQIAAGT